MNLKHALLVSAMFCAFASGAHAENLLRNPAFDFAWPGGLPPTTVGTAANLGGASAAEYWTTWARVAGGTVATNLAGNDRRHSGNMIHVVVHGGSGLVQAFLGTEAGPKVAYSCAWVKVVSGRIGIGLGNGGNTHMDASSTGIGTWERLAAPNGVTPANEFIIYAISNDAEYYVDSAVVSTIRSDCFASGNDTNRARPETYVKPDPKPWTLHPEQGNAQQGDPSQGGQASPKGHFENMAPGGKGNQNSQGQPGTQQLQQQQQQQTPK